MGIFAAERVFLGEINVLDGGIDIYGGENTELGVHVSGSMYKMCHSFRQYSLVFLYSISLHI